MIALTAMPATLRRPAVRRRPSSPCAPVRTACSLAWRPRRAGSSTRRAGARTARRQLPRSGTYGRAPHDLRALVSTRPCQPAQACTEKRPLIVACAESGWLACVSTLRARSGGKQGGARSTSRCDCPCASRTSGRGMGNASAENMHNTRRSAAQLHRDESKDVEGGVREQEQRRGR
jgi:hypothetical protein